MHVADLHATLCQLAGAPLGGHELGVPAISSLPMWDYLSGKVPQSPRTEVPLSTVNWHGLHFNFSLNESAAVIVGRHKLVVGSQAYLGFWQGPRYPNQSTPCGPEHVHGSSAVCGAGCGTGCVFDIFADPSEHVDLAPQLPELKAQLLARLQRMREERFQTDDDNSRLNFTSIGWTKPIATEVKDSQGGFWGPYGVSKTDDDAKRVAARLRSGDTQCYERSEGAPDETLHYQDIRADISQVIVASCADGYERVRGTSAYLCKGGAAGWSPAPGWQANDESLVCVQSEASPHCSGSPSVEHKLQARTGQLGDTIDAACAIGFAASVDSATTYSCKASGWALETGTLHCSTNPSGDVCTGKPLDGFGADSGHEAEAQRYEQVAVRYNDIIEATCENGYARKEGTGSVYKCQGGQWAHMAPTIGTPPRRYDLLCVDGCAAAPSQNTDGHCRDTKSGSACTAKCKSGFAGTGNPDYFCGSDGLWSEGSLQCNKVCQLPQKPAQPHVSQSDCPAVLLTGGSCEIHCEDGYEQLQSGTYKYHCDAYGKLSIEPRLPDCQRVHPSRPPSPATPDTPDIPSIVWVACGALVAIIIAVVICRCAKKNKQSANRRVYQPRATTFDQFYARMGLDASIRGLDAIRVTSLQEALTFIKGQGAPSRSALASGLRHAEAKADELLEDGPDEHGLTRDEIAAINLYTQELMYEPLNRALWSKERGAVKPYWGFIRLLQQALFKVPKSTAAMIYRGIRNPYEPITEADMLARAEDRSRDHPEGGSREPIMWWGFSSCSTSQQAVMHFLNQDGADVERILYTIEGGSSARDVRKYSVFGMESEALMPFGSSFTVVTASRPTKPGEGPEGTLLLVTLRQNKEFALGEERDEQEPEPEPETAIGGSE